MCASSFFILITAREGMHLVEVLRGSNYLGGMTTADSSRDQGKKTDQLVLFGSLKKPHAIHDAGSLQIVFTIHKHFAEFSFDSIFSVHQGDKNRTF